MRSVYAIVALAALGISAEASASSVDLGDIGVGDSTGASLFYGTMGQSIDDTWTFTLTSDAQAAIVVDSAELTGFYGIDDFLVAGPDGGDISFTYDAHDNSYSFTGVLPAGDYSLSVSGMTSGVLGGEYQVAVGALAPAAVPLPAPLALLASGLFALGTRRRNKKSA